MRLTLHRRGASRSLGAALAVTLAASSALAAPKGDKPSNLDVSAAAQPFGANLFLGNFQKEREDGLNPDYEVMPGDRVAVNTWGAVELSSVFVVDGQGNIFLPGIGPVALAGVRNAKLTATVQQSISKIYKRNFGVYTNLLTAAPVAVFVTGGVSRPGKYAGVPSDSVLFFLDQAGGIDPALGSFRRVSVLRGDQSLAEVDLYDFILAGTLPTIQFADGDTILVHRRGEVVEVEGGMAGATLLEFEETPISGAAALEILPKAARATEVTIQGVRDGKPFSRTMTATEFRDAELRDGDKVQYRDDGLSDTILVKLDGEFKGPSMLSVQRGSRLVDVLNYIEVDPELSDAGSVHLRRPGVAASQKKSIEDSLHRLERSAMLALSDTDREASIRAKEAELMKAFVESARRIEPLGRIVTSVRRRQLNVLLLDGDTIVIPPKTGVVRVGGEVQIAQAVVYSPQLRVRDYIRFAGGYTDRSNEDKVIIVHASAAVVMGSPDSAVLPGDELLVPPEVDSKLLQNAADVTQVLYQIAVAAAVVLAL